MNRAPSMLARLKAAWLTLGCKGGPIFVHGSDAADNPQTARGQCVEISDALPSVGWRFCHGLHHCDRCPRFKAYRQGLSAHKDWDRYLSVPVSTQQIHADVRDGDREGAQVDQINQKDRGTVCGSPEGNLHLQSSPVLYPVSPGVVDTEHRTQQCDGKGHKLENGFGVSSHAATVAQEGGAA